MHVGLSNNQMQPSGMVFERSRRLRPDEATHVQRLMMFDVGSHSPPLYFLSPYLVFCVSPLKIQEKPFNLLIL